MVLEPVRPVSHGIHTNFKILNSTSTGSDIPGLAAMWSPPSTYPCWKK